MPNTHAIADVAEWMGAPSERWIVDQIRSGRFPARKIGRTWRMTDEDIADALDACSNTTRPRIEGAQHRFGLTATSKKRLARS